MFMKLPNQSNLFKCSNITNIYNWHQIEINETYCLFYIFFSILNSKFEISIKIFSIYSIFKQWK